MLSPVPNIKLPVNWEGSKVGVVSYVVNKYNCPGLAL